MKSFRLFASTTLTAALVLSGSPTLSRDGPGERFRPSGAVQIEEDVRADARVQAGPRHTEAPTGFDNRTNGFDPQGPAFDSLNEDNVEPLRSFNDNRFIFEEAELEKDGLGPTYNAQSCRECHQNVVTGGASQIAEHRTGRLGDGNVFFESFGGSLIHSWALTQTSWSA